MPRKGAQIAGSDTQMAVFLFALARGATVEEAAVAAGMSAATLYYRRKRCPVFAKTWGEAAAMAQAADIAARQAAHVDACAGRGTIVRGHPGRRLMRQRKRPVEFDRERKQAFLDHFAATCNLEESARVAGISLSTFYRALRNDAAFAEGFAEALKIGYLCMEAEAVREQRAAQRAYAIEPSDAAAKAQGFERTMQLLREYKRAAGPSTSLRTGGIGRRAERHGTRWTFDAAMAELEEGLKAFGVEIPDIGPEEAPPPGFTRSPSPPDGGEDSGGGDA